MEKIEYKEMMRISEKAEELVEQIFLDNSYDVQSRVKIGGRIADFLVEKHKKKYVIEVRRGDFDTGKMHAIANRLKDITEGTDYIPIFIIFSQKGSILKEQLEKNYCINIIDISNLRINLLIY